MSHRTPGVVEDLGDSLALLAIFIVIGAVIAGIAHAALTPATVGWLVHQLALLVLGLAATLYAYHHRTPALAASPGTTYQRIGATLDDPPGR